MSTDRDRYLDGAAALAAALLAVGYAAVIWRSGAALGIRYPLGSDGPLWFDSARLATTGEPLGLPPLLPRLLALLSGGAPRVSVGQALNAGLVGLTLLGASAGAALCAQDVWVRRAAALAAPLVVLTAADPAVYAWFIHPESLITALLVWSGALAVLYVRRPSWRTAALLGLCCGMAMSAKEHGLVVAVLAPVGVLAVGGPGRGRRLAGWLAGMLPMLLLQLLDEALFAKAWASLQESLGWLSPAGEAMEVLPVEMTDAQQQQVREGGLLRVTLGQMVSASRAWWPVYLSALAAGAGLLARRRWPLAAALALPLMTLAPAAVVWTEPRHYLVVAPAAALLAVGGAARLVSPLGGRGALGLAAACGLAAALAAPQAGRRLGAVQQEIQALQRERGDEYAALMWLLANLHIDDRIILQTDPVVLGKLPFMPIPDGRPIPAGLPGAVYLITDRGAPRGAWEEAQALGSIRIYRRKAP